MSLSGLQPAEQGLVMLYLPYSPKQAQRVLPLSLGLYQRANLEGERQIEGGRNIPFVASWSVSKLPAELTRFRIQFDGDADLSYEMRMANSDFVNFLLELINNYRRSKIVDFSQSFYKKLLGQEE